MAEEMEKSVFIRVFGDYPAMRVLDFLLENRLFDYSKSDIARNTFVSRATLDPIIEALVKMSIIKQTRKIGRAVLYTLNEATPVVQQLIKLDFELSKAAAQAMIKKLHLGIKRPIRRPQAVHAR